MVLTCTCAHCLWRTGRRAVIVSHKENCAPAPACHMLQVTPLAPPPPKPKSKMVTSFWYPGHGLIACDTPGDKQSSFRNTTSTRRDQQATSKPQASLAPPLPKRKSQIVNPLLLLCNMENTCHSPRDDRRVTPIACVSKARNFCRGGEYTRRSFCLV